jgi:hypothetical protein
MAVSTDLHKDLSDGNNKWERDIAQSRDLHNKLIVGDIIESEKLHNAKTRLDNEGEELENEGKGIDKMSYTQKKDYLARCAKHDASVKA